MITIDDLTPDPAPPPWAAVTPVPRLPGEMTDTAIERARALLDRAVELDADGRHDEELALYDELVASLAGDERPPACRLVLSALYNKALTYGTLGRPHDELAIYDEILSRYDRYVALVDGRDDDDPGRDQAARALLAKAIWFDASDRYDEALSACDELAIRFGDAPDQRERLARTALLQASILAGRDDVDAALAAYDELVARYGHDPDPAVRDHVITALATKAAVLDDDGRHDEELAVYDEIVRRWGEASDPDQRETVARALIDKGITLSHNFERTDDAFAVYDEVVRRYGDADDAASCAAVVEALLNRAELLSLQERSDEELAVYDEIVVRYDRLVAVTDDDAEPPADLRDRVAAALHNKGLVLKEHEQFDRALVVFEEILVRFGTDEHPPVRQVVASAHRGRGQVLDELGDTDQAVAAFDDVVSLYDDADDLPLRQQVYEALVNKAATLAAAERPDEAIALYDDFARRFDQLVAQIDDELGGPVDDGPAARVHELAATAVLNHAVALSMVDRVDEELAAYDNLVAYHDALVARFDGPLPDAVRRSTAMALLYKAEVLERRGQDAAAEAAYDGVLTRFADDPDPLVQDAVADARDDEYDPEA